MKNITPSKAVFCGKCDFGDDVQAFGHEQCRYSPVYRMAVSALGDKTVLEPVRGHHQEQKVVDSGDGDTDMRGFGGRVLYHRHVCRPYVQIHACSLLDHSFRFGDTRYSGRRLLHAGIGQ